MVASVIAEGQGTVTGLVTGALAGVASYSIDLSAVGALGANEVLLLQVDAITNSGGSTNGAWSPPAFPASPSWLRVNQGGYVVAVLPSGTPSTYIVADGGSARIVSVAWHWARIGGINKNDSASYYAGTGITAINPPTLQTIGSGSIAYSVGGGWNPQPGVTRSVAAAKGYLSFLCAGNMLTPSGAPTATNALASSNQGVVGPNYTLRQAWGHLTPATLAAANGTLGNLLPAASPRRAQVDVIQFSHLKPDDPVLSQDLTLSAFDFTPTSRVISSNPNATSPGTLHGAFQGSIAVPPDSPDTTTNLSLVYSEQIVLSTVFCTVPDATNIVITQENGAGWTQLVNEAYDPSKRYTLRLSKAHTIWVTIYTTSTSPSGGIALSIEVPKSRHRGSNQIAFGIQPNPMPRNFALLAPQDPSGNISVNIGDTIIAVVSLFGSGATTANILLPMADNPDWTLIAQQAFTTQGIGGAYSLNVIRRTYDGSVGFMLYGPATLSGSGIFNTSTGTANMIGYRRLTGAGTGTKVVKNPPPAPSPEPTFSDPPATNGWSGATFTQVLRTSPNGGYLYNGTGSAGVTVSEGSLIERPTPSNDTSKMVRRSASNNPGNPNNDSIAQIVFPVNTGIDTYLVGDVAPPVTLNEAHVGIVAVSAPAP